jgi:hypothetical protein
VKYYGAIERQNPAYLANAIAFGGQVFLIRNFYHCEGFAVKKIDFGLER